MEKLSTKTHLHERLKVLPSSIGRSRPEEAPLRRLVPTAVVRGQIHALDAHLEHRLHPVDPDARLVVLVSVAGFLLDALHRDFVLGFDAELAERRREPTLCLYRDRFDKLLVGGVGGGGGVRGRIGG